MQCPGCGIDVPGSSKFCSSCGTVLQEPCSICGEALNVGSRFCGSCGNSTAEAAPGMTLRRAIEWRAMFEEMGWSEDPGDPERDEPARRLKILLLEAGIQMSETKDPYIFFTRLRENDWKIAEFTIDGRRVEADGQASRRWAKRGIMAAAAYPTLGLGTVVAAKAMKRNDQTWAIATRQRLIIANCDDMSIFQCAYSDVIDGSADGKGTFTLRTSRSVIAFKVRVKGVRAARFIAIGLHQMTPHNQPGGSLGSTEAEYARGMRNLDMTHAAGVDFMTAIRNFVAEIVAVGEQRR